ncbi:deoxynucleoside kinase-like [Gigantopelta aegis]|uniref:deoxynucleoside kinase-like n=1 Tax=Gigantopelta aegis TaxID=1735272 RepID=UPI001B88D150|nr:deoxynucleoside kinase-like [Gigantopelta aegis]
MLGTNIFKLENLHLTNTSLCSQRETKSRQSFTVAVEGNIGSGKSTFLDHFKSNPNVEIFPEPVEKWKSVKGFNSLDLMYKDAARWSFAFQSYVTLTMIEHHQAIETPGKVKMIERSIYSARHCFIENLSRGGLMPAVDYNILLEWHDWIHKNADTHIDLIVYLKARPEICQERIRIRNRHEEQSVPLEYLQTLHSLHEEWLIEKKAGELPAPVLVINAEVDETDLKKTISKLEPQILCGISSNQTS